MEKERQRSLAQELSRTDRMHQCRIRALDVALQIWSWNTPPAPSLEKVLQSATLIYGWIYDGRLAAAQSDSKE